MKLLLNVIDRLSRFAETAAVALLLGYCALMLAEVVARSQANSLSFSWEFSQYAMAAIFALASGPAIRAATHVRITLLLDILPPDARRWFDVVANVVALGVAGLIVLAMWEKTGRSFDRSILATTVTRTPLWIPQAVVLWGFSQLWLDLLARVIRRVRGLPYEWRALDSPAIDEDSASVAVPNLSASMAGSSARGESRQHEPSEGRARS